MPALGCLSLGASGAIVPILDDQKRRIRLSRSNHSLNATVDMESGDFDSLSRSPEPCEVLCVGEVDMENMFLPLPVNLSTRGNVE